MRLVTEKRRGHTIMAEVRTNPLDDDVRLAITLVRHSPSPDAWDLAVDLEPEEARELAALLLKAAEGNDNA